MRVDERTNLEECVGKTGLFTYKYVLDPFFGFLSLDAKSNYARYLTEEIQDRLRRVLYKVVSDGRDYKIKGLNMLSYANFKPPYEKEITARVAVGLRQLEDCSIGEHYLDDNELVPAATLFWLRTRTGKSFRYEGDHLWLRES